MKALLDTHVFLWWLAQPERLSEHALDILGDRSRELYFSAASAWEIAIKVKLGKLLLPDSPSRVIPRQLELEGIETLPVQLSHALHTYTLPPHHRDPFDRLLVAQAQLEKLPILTSDPVIALYGVQILW